MNIATTIELDEKEARAFAKRVDPAITPEAFAAILVKEQARRWADADFDSGAADLVAAVRAEPLAVQDAIVTQVTQSVATNT